MTHVENPNFSKKFTGLADERLPDLYIECPASLNEFRFLEKSR